MQGNSAIELLRSLKATSPRDGARLCIPVGMPPKAFLRPVATAAESLDPFDVERLTAWRNRFVHSFLTEFEATEQQTAHWLTTRVASTDNKILFMVDEPDGKTVGYMGLDFIDWDRQCGEADAVVRGVTGSPGIMRLALETLLEWSQTQLGLRSLGVRVRSDNKAIAFYEKLGFREVRRIPLKEELSADMIRWVEADSIGKGPVCLVHFVYDRCDTQL